MKMIATGAADRRRLLAAFRLKGGIINLSVVAWHRRAGRDRPVSRIAAACQPTATGAQRSGNVHHIVSGATCRYRLVAAVLFNRNREDRLAPTFSKIELEVRAEIPCERLNDL